jgi:hypothetical protein
MVNAGQILPVSRGPTLAQLASPLIWLGFPSLGGWQASGMARA